ncbi:hypothetical protein DICPUDRAFT_91445 [Dictyostelium purpureum]|uniref:Phosphatidylinositol transfer protein N-terminal domain-containing protein n=1 Tax=Dictyostelium purpureum TaxID=5786 RepID=F0ZCJ5_DICPU|nr:uncharacterized protein DICPUDRAFT_91445 [Dictyostelium purpureum]EGC38278.1 hypothetical protein DICPUDRAFT_91445 [Dictyostelium purpureum]|eukprot:XP_003285139.1 hypothetical protein DICPUDRAFT_91445 [Dictyostelium purpureum]
MLIKEYRITLPLTTEEYRLGQKYMTTRKSNESSNTGENVEVLERSPFEDEDGNKGTYTHKLFLLNKSLPRYATAILPKSALKIEEKSWNSFPHTKTVYSCPFFGEKFYLCIESMHKDGLEEEENIFNLSKDTLKKRIVDHVDIANDPIDPKEYKIEEDPNHFKSKLTGRGPLTGKNWKKDIKPAMTCYKLVTVNFNYWGFQNKIENLVQTNGLREVILKAHRCLICWLDEWINLSEKELEEYENSTNKNSPPQHQQSIISSDTKKHGINKINKCPKNCDDDRECQHCNHLMVTTTTTETITRTTTTTSSPMCCAQKINADSINVMN